MHREQEVWIFCMVLAMETGTKEIVDETVEIEANGHKVKSAKSKESERTLGVCMSLANVWVA